MADLTFNQSMLLKIRTALLEAVESGTQSATVSTGAGSEGFTRHSLAQLQAMEKDYARRVNEEQGFTYRTRPDFGGTD